MITGIPKIDNGLHEVADNLKKSLEKSEKFKNDMIIKLKNSNRKERAFLIFKLFFDGLNNYEKEALMDISRNKPFFFDRLWWAIDEANDARLYVQIVTSNRNINCIELMKKYKILLDKMSKLAKELNMNNSLELSILFSYLLWNGYLSKTKKTEFTPNDSDIYGLLFTEIINGIGVCRNHSEMLKDFLNNCGYSSAILANYSDDNLKINYTMDITGRKLYDVPSEGIFKKKKANHAFNLIEDNGLYIYDSTNLLLYNLKNKNTANLVNGKGKNIIYPYKSYYFCYSKDDEKLLDKLFSNETFTSSYTKTDFISTSEVTLEILKNFTSLLEDFYKEARPDIVGISEETKKALIRAKLIK